MSILKTLFATIGCAFIIYQLAKPYFYKEDPRLKDWNDNRKKNRRKR